MHRYWPSIRSAVRKRFRRAKVVVYTAVTGDYDIVRSPLIKIRGWRYLCFTDDTSVRRPGWEAVALAPNRLDPIRRARFPKILAHRFLHDYDLSIYVDANVGIAGDLAALLEMALQESDIAFFRHGEYRQTVAAEIDACARQKKAPIEVMTGQYANYRCQGFPDGDGIIPETGVIIRRHHSPLVRRTMENWWAELLLHSTRDQISLPYVIWRSSLSFELLDWNLRECPWFTYTPHVSSVEVT